MIGYVGQSKLSTANSNAKLVYTNTATYATKCEVAGFPMTKACSVKTATSLELKDDDATTVTAPTKTPTSTDLTNALKALMGSESTSAGVFSLSPTTHNYRNIDKNKQKWYNRSAREKAEKSKKACT